MKGLWQLQVGQPKSCACLDLIHDEKRTIAVFEHGFHGLADQ